MKHSKVEYNLKIKIPVFLDYLLATPLLLYRLLRYGYTFRRIKLTRGKYAIVDTEDFYRLNRYKWHTSGRAGALYAVRCVWDKAEKKTKSIKMHREILKTDDNLFVDHINGKGLDNRKANLREATVMQNSWNMKKFRRKTSSRYKGVIWDKRQKKWSVQINIYRESTFLGCFKDEIKAAKAYDKAAKKYFGEFARLNFPEKKKRRRNNNSKRITSAFFR